MELFQIVINIIGNSKLNFSEKDISPWRSHTHHKTCSPSNEYDTNMSKVMTDEDLYR
jgi:hypothetical protein